jgi:hypothetical protein
MLDKRTAQRAVDRAKRTKAFRGAHSVFSRFWGVRPTAVTTRSLPGPKNKVKIMVSLGRCPALTLANGPKGRATSQKRRRLSGCVLACDAAGKRLFVLNKRSRRVRGKGKRFLGWASVVEYIPTRSIERSGSFKSGKHWVHSFSDDHGKWPKAQEERDGTIALVGGTYRIAGKWLRR